MVVTFCHFLVLCHSVALISDECVWGNAQLKVLPSPKSLLRSESLGISKIHILKPIHQDESIKKLSSEEMIRSYGIYPDEWNLGETAGGSLP